MDIEYIKTSDLELASALLAIGLPIDGIYTKEGTNKLEFYFKKTEAVEKAINAYWGRSFSNTYHLEPLELFGARREILTRMKEGQNA